MREAKGAETYPDRTVLMVSGGIDSMTVAYFLRDRCKYLRMIAFNYGQFDFGRALQAVNWVSVELYIPVTIVDTPRSVQAYAGFIEQDYDGFPLMLTELSRKSARFTMEAGVYAESIGYHAIAEGVNKDDLERYVYRTQVHRHVEEVMSLGNQFDFRVITPLIDMPKAEVMKLAHRLGVPLEKAWSCWDGKVRHCGVCQGCLSRKARFRDAGIEDKTVYLE